MLKNGRPMTGVKLAHRHGNPATCGLPGKRLLENLLCIAT